MPGYPIPVGDGGGHYLRGVPDSGLKLAVRVVWDAPAMFVRSIPLVRADSGKVALIWGPLVYCQEKADNGSKWKQVIFE